MKRVQDKDAELQVQKDLVENGLAQYFKFNKLEIGKGKKMVAYLYRQKGSECKQCTDHLGVTTRHEKDNTHIIEYDYNNKLRK